MNAPPKRKEQLTLIQSDANATALTSPKRGAEGSGGSGKTYPYYAGFSEDFVSDVLRRSVVTRQTVVLDPWNGSGTTVKAAETMGVAAIGFDLNPVMVIVGRARLSNHNDFALARQALDDLLRDQGTAKSTSNDPLTDWVQPLTTRRLRGVVNRILAVDNYVNDTEAINQLIDELVPWRCLLLVSVFRAVKRLMDGTDSSNPTWTVIPDRKSRCQFSSEKIANALSSELRDICDALTYQPSSNIIPQQVSQRVNRGTSESIPLDDSSVDLVITSPPYCTRIDYAKATLIELSIIGLSATEVDKGLRKELIGTTAIAQSSSDQQSQWGSTCNDILDYVYSHTSKGSRSYYYKNFLQYFSSMHKSMIQLARVCKPNAFLYIVVQESFYKEKKIDLPSILCEMGGEIGLVTEKQVAFPVRLSMVNINTRSRRYRKHSDVHEKVLILRKN